MPLSEHEQRILADIEARLRADDPRFADVVGTKTVSGHLRRRLRWAVAGVIVGFILLFVGLQVGRLWGVLGFGLMLGGVYYGVTVLKQMAKTAEGDDGLRRGPLQRYLDATRRREDDAT